MNNEGVRYIDIFSRKSKDKDGKEVTYTFEELTIDFLKANYVDIELELAKTFNLVYETEKDGTTFVHLTGSVRIDHFREPTIKTGVSDKINKI